MTRPRTEPVRSNAVSAIAATGGTLPAPIAGAIAAIRLAPVPAMIVERDGEGLQRETTRRNRVVERIEQVADPECQTDSAEQSNYRTEQPDEGRFDQQCPGHLTSTGTDGAQQGVLALTLRGGDREHVVDHEHPHTEGNEREDREEQGDEPEAPFDVGLRLLGDLGRSQCLGDVRVEGGLDPPDQHIVTHRSVALDQDRIDETRPGDERLRRRGVEQRPCGVAWRHDVVIDGDSDHGELAGPGLGVDLDRVTEHKPAVGGGDGIESDFRRATRQPPLGDPPHRQRALVDRRPERRRRGAFDGFAVFVDDHRVTLHKGLCVGDTIDGSNLVDDIDRQSIAPLETEEALDRVRRLHVRIDALEDVGEQGVEGALHGVTKDERAAEERRAGHDGERSQNHSPPPRAHAPQREADQWALMWWRSPR